MKVIAMYLPQFHEVKENNNGGGTVAPQGHANIFEWMNAQVLTAPEVTGRNR